MKEKICLNEKIFAYTIFTNYETTVGKKLHMWKQYLQSEEENSNWKILDRLQRSLESILKIQHILHILHCGPCFSADHKCYSRENDFQLIF